MKSKVDSLERSTEYKHFTQTDQEKREKTQITKVRNKGNYH